MLRKSNAAKGMTLLELMFSLSILTLAFFAVTGIICLLLKGNQKTVDLSSGVIVANSLLEKYVEEKKDFLGDPITDKEVYGSKTYDYTIKAQKITTNLYEIEIVVRWDEVITDNRSQRYSSTISTLVYGNELDSEEIKDSLNVNT